MSLGFGWSLPSCSSGAGRAAASAGSSKFRAAGTSLSIDGSVGGSVSDMKSPYGSSSPIGVPSHVSVVAEPTADSASDVAG